MKKDLIFLINRLSTEVDDFNYAIFESDHDELIEKVTKIAEEFTVCFTNWCEENYYPSAKPNFWFDSYNFETAKKITTKELLEIYKKTL